MNEEVKEILEKLKDKDSWQYKLLDYITNLQNENEDLKDRLKVMEHFKNSLLEENEKYKKIFEGKERFSKIMPEDIDFIILSKADYDRQEKDIQLELIDYKTRCEKAIEFIKDEAGYDEEIRSCCCDLLYSDCDKLIELLNGDEE